MSRRLLFILFTFFCFSVKAQPFTSVQFSVQAHQDDWQLFMSSKVIADMYIANTKMVFITLTAGDESCGTCTYGSGPFYLGREIGSVYSSKFAADLTTGTTPTDVPAVTTVTINSHTIWKYTYKNTVNYFLRLPDGDVGGTGFGNNNDQSLQKLKSGAIPAINVIGNSVTPATNGPAALTYSWAQLTATIQQIILNEKVAGTQSWIHTAHTITGANSAYNPGDHSDHRYSSLAAQEAVSSLSWVGVNGFMDYSSSSQVANLSTTQQTNATIAFSLETFGMTEKEYQNEFASSHVLWLPMDYYISPPLKTPSGVAPLARINEEDNGIATLKKENEKVIISDATDTKMPMIISVTSPVAVDKDITMSISPYEAGELSITVYDTVGNKVYDLVTTVKNRDALTVTLKNAVKTKGSYVIKSVLNNRFIESRNIIVE